jgi:NhaP-type Na+/H+ or K+/H+ antiporter
MLAFLVLGLFGGALASGVLAGVGWREAVFALLALLVVRPVTTLLGFVGSMHPAPVRLAAGYFGIRGLGSLYYIGYAAGAGALPEARYLWSVMALTVLFSIVLYGTTAKYALGLLDRTMRQSGEAGPDPPPTADMLTSPEEQSEARKSRESGQGAEDGDE